MAWGRKNEEDEIDFYQTNEDFGGDSQNEFSLYDEDDESPKKKRKKEQKKTNGPARAKNRRKSEQSEELPSFSYDEEDYTVSDDEKAIREKKRIYKKIRRISFICLYLFFIGIGVFSTTYHTGVPQKINVNLREARSEFNMVENHYNKQVSILYELKHLDENVEKDGADQSFIYAVNYKDFEGLIEANVKEVQGNRYSTDYEFMKDINVVIYDNLFKYVSLMSDGLSSQNTAFIQDAQKYKKNYMTAFEKYTSNLEQFRELVGLSEEE